MKTDARVRYTKHIIQDVFIATLKEKPINKITVKEICDKAEINRTTFYKHYMDVYDLLEQLEKNALDFFEELLVNSNDQGTTHTLIYLLDFLKDNHDLIISLMKNTPNNHFMSDITECCTRYALSTSLTSHTDFLNNSKTQIVYSFISGGTSNLIQHWFENGMKESSAEVADYIEALKTASLSI